MEHEVTGSCKLEAIVLNVAAEKEDVADHRLRSAHSTQVTGHSTQTAHSSQLTAVTFVSVCVCNQNV